MKNVETMKMREEIKNHLTERNHSFLERDAG